MARVHMLQHISGGRGDGTEWPHRGESLECDDAEARFLVTARLASWPPDAAVPAAVPHPPLAVPPPPPGDAPPPDDDPDSPAVRAAKQAWVEHAVAVGCDPGVAASMTKADLIATYGNPG